MGRGDKKTKLRGEASVSIIFGRPPGTSSRALFACPRTQAVQVKNRPVLFADGTLSANDAPATPAYEAPSVIEDDVDRGGAAMNLTVGSRARWACRHGIVGEDLRKCPAMDDGVVEHPDLRGRRSQAGNDATRAPGRRGRHGHRRAGDGITQATLTGGDSRRLV